MEKSGLLSKKISYALFASFGILFVFFAKTEGELAEKGNLLWTAGYTWQTVLISLVFGSALGIALGAVFYRLADRRRQGREKEAVRSVSPRIVFWGSLVLILLAWLPAYLAYYPGICAYDFPIQLGQTQSGLYIDHHPIAHTLLIKGAVTFGRQVLGSVNAGIAALSALQMIFLAGAMAWGLSSLKRMRVSGGYLVLLLLFCMFYPFCWYMSISITKDVVFSGFALMFVTALSAALLEGRDQFRPGRQDILLAVSGIGMILFRTNGKYAFLVLLFFLGAALLAGKGRRLLWGRLLVWCGAAFCVGNILLALLFSATEAQQGDRREMLSMPIQQLARVMIYHGGVNVLPEDDGGMDEKDRALINDFLLDEAYRFYRPDISDPVKRHTNTYVVRYRTGEFLSTYVRLLARYPGDFINACLALNAGYLYPGDVSHAHVNEEEGARNKGYVQTRWDEESMSGLGIFKDSKWESLHRHMEEWAEENRYLEWPVLKYLFVPGTCLYLYLLLFGWLMIRRRFRLCMPLAFVLGYYLTLFLGPTVQLRYLYPLMLALPFSGAWAEAGGVLGPRGESADV